MVVLLLVAGSLYLAYVFSYLYLWTVAPQGWPQTAEELSLPLVYVSAGLLVLGSAAMAAASFAVSGHRLRRLRVAGLLLAALMALAGSLAIEVLGHWQSLLRPTASGYAAMVYMASFLQAQLVVALLVMIAFAVARLWTGQVDAVRRVTVDNTAILLHYAAGQGLLGLALIHAFPRLVA
jgi:cytochrome c oxidase subunit I+III